MDCRATVSSKLQIVFVYFNVELIEKCHVTCSHHGACVWTRFRFFHWHWKAQGAVRIAFPMDTRSVEPLLVRFQWILIG